MANKKIAQLGRHKRYLAQIEANGGGIYVQDCWPWNIKSGCNRLDCPMRTLTIAPEAKTDDFFVECTPAGDLADLLIRLQSTSPLEKIK